MKRKTHKEFVAEMAAKHPDIEVVGTYTRSSDSVACRCKICGHEWSPVAAKLSAGKGCPGCKVLNASKRLRKTHEEFIAEMAAKNHDIEVIGTYTGANDPVACRCRKCGYEWSPRATSLLRGTGCPKCAGNARKTHEEFIAEMAAKHPDIEVVGTYTRSSDPVACRCRKCGREWSPVASSLSRGQGCPGCQALNTSKRCRKTHEEFLAEMAVKHPDIEVVGTYTGTHDPIACRCRKCGHEWSPAAGSLSAGYGCPGCQALNTSKQRRKTHEQFIAELQSVNKNVEVLSRYETSRTKLRCRCRLCGNTWEVTPGHLLRGNGCPACSHVSTSFMEQFVLISLRKVLGDSGVVSRDTDRIGMELDIMIPDYDYAIEIGSWFWHKSKLDNDDKKKQLCIDAGITLLTVYDSCDESMSPEEHTLIFPFDLATEKDYLGLKQIVNRVLKDIGKREDLNDAFWEDINEAAYISSRKRTTEEFVETLERINPDIQVLGEYRGAGNNIECRCKKCGHEWSPMAGSLLRGTGCPKCAGNIKKRHEDFVAEIAAKHPDIEVIGTYIGARDPVACRCRKCGHEWSPAAGSLSAGQGCPKCAGSIKKTHKEFVAEMAAKHPDIEIVGTYTGTHDPIACRCRKCGHEWSPVASSLSRGQGCPKCAGTMRKTHKEFIAEMAAKHPNIEIVGTYTRTSDRVSCRCRKCGHEWSPVAGSLSAGHGCPGCQALNTSKQRRKTHEEFVAEMAAKYPDIEIVGAYTRNSNRVACRCRKCGYEWSPLASNLSAGHGCPKCAGRIKTHEEFIAEMAAKHPDIEVVGIYTRSSDPVACRCRKCGHEWSPAAGSLSAGQGCPGCKALNTSKRLRKTHEEFIAEMAAKHPDIEVVGTYARANDPVACRCRKCGYEWSPRAANLLSGTGCPKCAGTMKKTHEEFVAEMAAKHPDIEVVGAYTRNSDPVACRCRKCGYEWSPKATILLRGRGCPKCARKR